jgi:hypothetical protein
MLATQPAAASARAAYLDELEATIAQTTAIAKLATLPWSLLTLNATFYLDSLLTAAAYRSALGAALQRSMSERTFWPSLPGTPQTESQLQRLIESGTARPALYRWLFEQAIESRNPAQFLLAQHACEIADVLDERLLWPALRLGLIAVPAAALETLDPTEQTLTSAAESIEIVSGKLLRYRISARHFAARLLLLHATRRAQQLSGMTLSAPVESIAPLPTPKRLRIVQPHELAQQAVASGAPLAITMIEAGLVEAEELRGGSQLLLLTALEQALARLR